MRKTKSFQLKHSKTKISELLENKAPFCLLRFPNEDEKLFTYSGSTPPENQAYVVISSWEESQEKAYFLEWTENFKIHDSQKAKTPEEVHVGDFEEYERAFSKIQSEIQSGSLSKVILSRIKKVDLPQSFNPIKAFTDLCQKYPYALCSLILHPEEGLWIGASPELLLSKQGNEFNTVSLAGTKPNNGAPINWTEKEIREQELVSGHIRSVLSEFDLTHLEESERETKIAGPVAHLETRFSFGLRAASDFSNLVSSLHPTPAIAGLPVVSSKELISETEKHKRRLYCGYIGEVKTENTANFFVNLRCMQIFEDAAYLYLGGGITAESELESEWEETENKAKTLTGIIND